MTVQSVPQDDPPYISGVGAEREANAEFGLTRLMGALLYGVDPVDPLTFGLVAVSLSVVALLASYVPALLHGSELRKDPPSRELGSGHSVTVGHPETGHRIEDLARQLYFNALPGEGSTSHTSTDDRLIPVDSILDHAALATGRLECSHGFGDRSNLMRRSRLYRHRQRSAVSAKPFSSVAYGIECH